MTIKGSGLGLRPLHFSHIVEDPQKPYSWGEILLDNFLADAAGPKVALSKMAETLPLAFHCVGMNIAGQSNLDTTYLKKVKNLCDLYNPVWVSDHLCWTNYENFHLHELLPFPYIEEYLDHIIQRVQLIQDIIERPLVIENVSRYVTYYSSVLSEAEFLKELQAITQCHLLFDLNNLYVNHINHGDDINEFFELFQDSPPIQCHLGGHLKADDYLIDTHGAKVVDPVWELYRQMLLQWGDIPTCIEWDQQIPAYSTLCQEIQKMNEIRRETLQ